MNSSRVVSSPTGNDNSTGFKLNSPVCTKYAPRTGITPKAIKIASSLYPLPR
ncbi:hypothetical protein D3C73_1572850 [compost metagenome]